MVHAKNYETVSTFVKVTQKKPWLLFFLDTVYISSRHSAEKNEHKINENVTYVQKMHVVKLCCA